jgi:hypothetical protein
MSPVVSTLTLSSNTFEVLLRVIPGDLCSSVLFSGTNSISPLIGSCKKRGRSFPATLTLQPVRSAKFTQATARKQTNLKHNNRLTTLNIISQ